MIVRLGSGQAARRGCGPKAALLDRAARAGLPVPPGAIVLDEGWRSAIERGLVRIKGTGSRQSVSVPDPTLLVHLLGLPRLDEFLAIRSAFSLEDGEGESQAGAFVTGLFVDGRRSAAVAAGLAGVWASAFGLPRGVRRDVIIQAMVAARRGGVAFTEREHEDDVVNATGGTAQRLLGGKVPGDAYVLPKRRGAERPTESDPVAARLQVLLRGVRGVFGESDWDVEWADDGERIWLVQVRAVSRPTRRDEAFTAAGHREILPDPPSRFTTSLIASCADRLFDFYRGLDDGLPASRPLVEVFRDRPFVNLSLLTDMMRRWGLPTRLVTDSIGGVSDRDFELQPVRLLRHLPVLLRLARAQLGAAASARRAASDVLARTESFLPRLPEAIEVVRAVHASLATGMFSLTIAMSVPLALLRRAGVLTDAAARWRSAGDDMVEELGRLRQAVFLRPELVPALERKERPGDERFGREFAAFLSRHGHRGIYESDLSRPRYREDPAPLLRSLASPPSPLPPPSPPSLCERLLLPLVWQVGAALRARETLRSAAMVSFGRVRAVVLTRARDLVLDGCLPAAEAIWQLDMDEVIRLDEGFRPDAEFWRRRSAEIEAARGYDFPEVFHRFDDVESFRAEAVPKVSAERLRGVPLTRGQARGRAWVLAEPSVELPEGFSPGETILVARAVDAGWIPTFARVAGVVVELGGDLSHGSIVLREIGLPAVTAVRGATRSFRTGDGVLLRADEGVVERVREGPAGPPLKPSSPDRPSPPGRPENTRASDG